MFATAVADVLANDHDSNGDLDPTTLTIATAPNQGTASAANANVTFTAPDTVGIAVLTYRICDRGGRCTTTTATFIYG